MRDRSRSAGRRAHDLNAKLRTRNPDAKNAAMQVVRCKNLELATLAETAAKDAERLLTNDPATGVIRHVDAGYPEAMEAAQTRGVRVPGTW